MTDEQIISQLKQTKEVDLKEDWMEEEWGKEYLEATEKTVDHLLDLASQGKMDIVRAIFSCMTSELDSLSISV